MNRQRAKKIGLVGLGLMGHGIAKNIIKAGFKLQFFSHEGNQPCDDLLRAGASSQHSLSQLAEASDIMILCVTGTPEIEQRIYGKAGLLETMPKGACIIDCSTAIPSSTLKIAQACKKRGLHYLDAPMTRTPKEAELGKLNLIVGGERRLFDEFQPLFECFAENITYAGKAGAGHQMKLLHNFVSLGFSAVLAEASACATKTGISHEVFLEVLGKGGGAGVIFDRLRPYIADQDSSAFQFSLANASKDMGYYCQMAKEVDGADLTAKAIDALYKVSMDKIGGDAPVPEIIDSLVE